MLSRTLIWLTLSLSFTTLPLRAEETSSPAPATGEAPAAGVVPVASEAPAASPPTEGAAASPSQVEPRPAAAPVVSAPGDRPIVILPPEFTVYQLSVGGAEPVPEWTKAATENLLASATTALKAQPGFRLLDLPAMDEAGQATLREHVELFKIIAFNLDFTVKTGGKPWQDVRDRTDFSVGEGLRFLREQTGADYAFVLAGIERRASGGSIFMQFALAAAGIGIATGAGSYVYCGIIDLRSGQLTWFGSKAGSKEFGIGSSANAAKKEGAESTVAAMFKTYPDSPGLNFRAAQAAP